jgi:hypothetical protein
LFSRAGAGPEGRKYQISKLLKRLATTTQKWKNETEKFPM